jgi:CheY-like chemotaxis protein
MLEKPLFEGEVLLCEDIEINSYVICEQLERMGLTTVAAANGREGLEMVRSRLQKGEKPFDLIFMDIYMPVMDGFEAAEEILKLDIKTPIIALTANLTSADREKCLAKGMSDCMDKPFTAQALWSCLLKHLAPVKRQAVKETQQTQADEKLRSRLICAFVENNRGKDSEIAKAIGEGDRKLAHRLAHSLKSSAGLLGKTRLQKAAENLECLLLDETHRASSVEIQILGDELNAVLEELAPLAAREVVPVRSAARTEAPDARKAEALIRELQPLLEGGNLACLQLIDSLRLMPGSEEIIRQIENFDFPEAMETLARLKQEWL